MPHPLESSLGFLITRTSRLMGNRLQRKFREAGYQVTREQWMVLRILWERDGLTQQELAAGCFKDKTSITRLIDNMERSNLVVRVPDKQDRRSRLIYLTRQARGWKEPLIAEARHMLEEAGLGIDASEMHQCKAILQQVIGNLEGLTQPVQDAECHDTN